MENRPRLCPSFPRLLIFALIWFEMDPGLRRLDCHSLLRHDKPSTRARAEKASTHKKFSTCLRSKSCLNCTRHSEHTWSVLVLCRLLGFFFNDVHSLVFLIGKTNRPNPEGHLAVAGLSGCECPELGSTRPGVPRRERRSRLTGGAHSAPAKPSQMWNAEEMTWSLIWPDQCCPPCPWARSWDRLHKQVRHFAMKKNPTTPNQNSLFPFPKGIPAERAAGMC